MKFNKFTVILAILLISILAIGAVSAESVDDSDIVAIADGDIGDIQESINDADTADDLSAADIADETVGDDGGSPNDTVDYDLDDDTYSTYFNEDGTATDALSADGNYYLNVGTLTNKDIKILTGQNIYIQGKEGAGIINNGTITLGSGAIDDIDTVQITGITFINTNKNPIVVNQYAKDVAIARNNFNLTYDATFTENAIAIMTKGLVDDVTIVANNIKMTSAASYTYGLDLTYYLDWYTYADGNAKNFYIADNTIDIESTTLYGMAEAMYLDTLIDSEITGNNIHVKTVNPGVSNYGMQVADSWGFLNDPWADSPYNVAIKDNTIVLDAADLAYGISAISLWPSDEDGEDIVKDIVISGNDVTINTQAEGVGISATSSDVSITDNKVTLNAAHGPVQAYTDSYIGNISYAIFVNNFNKDMGNFVNNTVTGNTITTNVRPIKATKEDSVVQPLTIEQNTMACTINDDNYAIFFNEDGSVTDALSDMGDYALLIETLNNKDIVIASGSNINVTASENGGFINGGTITIGDGEGSAGSIIVTGLTFTNTNKNPIVINQYSTKVTIEVNKFDLTYDADYAENAIAIITKGYVEDIDVSDNIIDMTSAASYTYGVDFAYYYTWYDHAPTNAKGFTVSGNDISIVSTASSGMAEALYLDTLIDTEISNNNIYVKTTNPRVSNYGMQVADSWGFLEDDFATSPYNVTIKGNTIVLDAADLAYGISAISLWPYDEEYENIVKDIVISGNDVTINTQTEGVGISATSSDVSITDNKVTLNAAHDPVQAYTDSYIGNISYAIFVNNFNEDMGNFVNNTVTGNTIVSNVEAIKATKEDSDVQPLTIENNTVSTGYIIDDGNYATYFNPDGTIKDDAPFVDGDILVLGDLTGKKLVIDLPVTINAVPDKKLVNSTINLITGADGTVIDGLTMEFTGDDTTGSIGLIYAKEVNDIAIINNKIVVPDFVDKAGAKYGSSIYAIEIESGADGCDNVTISGNNIDINGSNRYIYGIDVFHTWGEDNKRISNITISDNEVNINGASRMAEAIYVSECDDVTITGNNATVTSDAAAYGIATDQLTNSVIADNEVVAISNENMAYGITSTTDGEDITIENNNITATGVGAVGIGLSNQDKVTVDGNNININGGDFTKITSADNLGTANAAILDKDGKNTNLNVGENTLIENGKETNVIKTGDGGKDLQNLIDATPAGSTLDLGNQIFNNVANVEINKDITIVGGILIGKEGEPMFTVSKKRTETQIVYNNMTTTAVDVDTDGRVGKYFTFTLKDKSGKALANKPVQIGFNGVVYNRVTDSKGQAKLQINLKNAGTYTFAVSYLGDDDYNGSFVVAKIVVKKQKGSLTVPAKSYKASAKTKSLTATFKSASGKVVKGKKITFTVNGKTYSATTNAKGVATVKVSLNKKGTYSFTAKFAGNNMYAAITKKAKLTIK
ncbi:hypothetical protein [Methanobrevibacter sp.]